MAIMLQFTWDGVTPEQYDAVRAEVGWLEEPPAGGRVHTAAFSDGTLHITDVWDSAEDFQAFAADRLMPVVQRLGVPGEPTIRILPLHEVSCPEPATVLLSSV
ncbi:MAG TPA: hypothetical protein VFJ85_09250 [Acidimicrobiales bacterium]|nr:hypothetical protein [Acidimicrobiales bacterium]